MKTNTETVDCFNCQGRPQSLFQPLTISECEKVSAYIHTVLYKKNELIFHEGRWASNLFCIQHGIVKTYTVDDDGKELIVNLLGDNDSFGYRSILHHAPYGLSAKALEDTLICLFPTELFNELLISNTSFSKHLLYLMAEELKNTQRMVIHLGHKYVRERIALKLLDLQNKFGPDKNGYLRVKLTRSEMANMVGTATESAIRLLHEMEREKMISIKGRNIKITDQKLLMKAAGAR